MLKISVIVPVYNAENYLAECINSILSQSYKNIELILVNDGSTDSSKLICEEFSQKDKRVKFLNKENGGAASARNYGLKASTGEIITFVDADDFIDKEMYQQLIRKLEDEDLDIVICETINYYKTHQYINTELTDGVFNSNDILQHYFLGKITSSMCDKIYRRKCFRTLSIFPEGKIAEDHKALFEVVSHSNKIGIIARPFYYYRCDDLNSVTKSIMTDKVLDIFEIKESILKQSGLLSSHIKDAYMIPTVIYTKARLVSETTELSNRAIQIIEEYYHKYKLKSLFNRHVPIRIKITTLALITHSYSYLRSLYINLK